MTSKRQTAMQRATVRHRRTMDRVLDRSVTAGVRDDFQDELDKLERDLVRNFKSRGLIKATRSEVALVTKAVRARMKSLAERVADRMVDTSEETQAEAVRSLAKFLHTIKPQGTVLDDHAQYQKIVRKDKRSINARRRESGRALAKSITASTRDSLLVENLEGVTSREMAKTVMTTVEKQWWQIDRTIRTENSIAFNQAQYSAFLEFEGSGIFMRWTEMVNDITGVPLDKRVANDSLVLHGQLAAPGGSFTMPPHPLAPKHMVGKSWMSPPNRPNDRAVLTPWAPGQGVEGWQWQNNRRITTT